MNNHGAFIGMRLITKAQCIVMALVIIGSGLAAAETPPAETESSTSVMTLMPAATPISNYTGDDWLSGACFFCFGEIGEQRQKLYERGVALDVSVTQMPQGVVSGGVNKTWQYAGNIDYYLALDSDRLGLWPGGLVKLTGRTKFGRGVLPQAGSISPVSYGWLLPSPENESESFLEEYYITQGLTDWAALVAGRLLLGNVGDSNRLAGNEQTLFVNTSLRNSPLLAVLTSSLSVHTVAARLQATPHLAIVPLALSRNDEDGNAGSPGGLFSDYTVGALVFIDWEIAGLSGEMQPRGGYTNKEVTAFDDPLLIFDFLTGSIPKKDGNWLVGFSANQYLYQPKQASDGEVQATPFLLQPEGIGVFMRFDFAPKDRNLYNIFLSGGITGRGVIPTRPLDRYGIGFYGLFLSDDFEDQPILGDFLDDEWGMEVFYNLALTPWLQLSLSLQYIESGRADVDDAVIVTTRVQIYF